MCEKLSEGHPIMRAARQTEAAMKAARALDRPYGTDEVKVAKLIDRETNLPALLESHARLVEALTKLEWTTAGVMAEITAAGPTEMVCAIFDGRELALCDEARTEAKLALAKAKEIELERIKAKQRS